MVTSASATVCLFVFSIMVSGYLVAQSIKVKTEQFSRSVFFLCSQAGMIGLIRSMATHSNGMSITGMLHNVWFSDLWPHIFDKRHINDKTE